ncbi:MAG: hypothetical protein U1E89_23935 [Burkholderiaceae bacterium]
MNTASIPSAFVLAACLSGCATPAPDADPATRTGAQIATAATTPLADLNLVNAPIPPVLLEALRAPYAPPADTGCDALAAQVKALDAVLGTDLDAPPPGADAGLVERGAELIGSAAADSVRAGAESVVPFRRWVRKLSGAERYSKEVAAAIAAGTVRRSFLKGIGQARACAAPAAPAAASAKR